jgi:hypothetical protein
MDAVGHLSIRQWAANLLGMTADTGLKNHKGTGITADGGRLASVKRGSTSQDLDFAVKGGNDEPNDLPCSQRHVFGVGGGVLCHVGSGGAATPAAANNPAANNPAANNPAANNPAANNPAANNPAANNPGGTRE